MILEIELLKDDDIKKIKQILKSATYTTGKLSSGENSKVKISEVLDQNSLEYKTIYGLLSESISNNITFSVRQTSKQI